MKAEENIATVEALAVRPERAAEMLDCSRSQIYRLIQAGQIKAVKMSGGKKSSFRVVVASIHQFLGETAAPAFDELPALTNSELVAGVQGQARRSSRAW